MDQRMIMKKTSNALQRLDEVEKTLTGIIPAINNSFANLSNQVQGAVEVLDAVVQALGTDTIEKIMTESRMKKATEQSEAEKRALDELVARGDLAPVEKVSEKSVIVGQESNPDGTVRHPGRAQVSFNRVDPKFQADFLGQAVGFTKELPNGGKFEVKEIYEVVEKKPEAAPAAAEATTPAAPEAK